MERSAGLLRGIALWFQEAIEAANYSDDRDEWLHTVMVEAIEREADKLQGLAKDLYRLSRGERPAPAPLTLVGAPPEDGGA